MARQPGKGETERKRKEKESSNLPKKPKKPKKTIPIKMENDGIALSLPQTAPYLDWKVISKLHVETGSVVVEAKRCQVEISLDPLGS